MGVKTLRYDRYREAFLLHADEYRSLFEARRVYDNERVIVEAVTLSHASVEEREELIREYTQLLALQHDCILSVQNIHYDTREGHCLLIESEHVHGSLDASIRDAAGVGIPFDEEYIWDVLERIASGLVYLYTNDSFSTKAHGRVWPSDVLRTASGKLVLKDPLLPLHLTDRLLPPEYRKSEFCYLAPETVQSKSLSEFSDIWMVGCLLYELCTLHPPPISPGVLTETPDLPALQHLDATSAFSHELVLCIKSCLHYLPELRPSASMLKDLCARRSASTLSNEATGPMDLAVNILSTAAHSLDDDNQMKTRQSLLLKESKAKLTMARDALLFMAIRNNDLADVLTQKATFLRDPYKYFQRAIDDCRPEIIYQFCLWNYEHNLGITISARKGTSTNVKTPLMNAALAGNAAGVLENLHLSGKYCYDYLTGGETALYYAVLGHNPECVKLLLCELGIYNEKGHTASSLLQLSKGFQHDYANLLLPEQWIQPQESIAQYLLPEGNDAADDFDALQTEAEAKLDALSKHINTKVRRKKDSAGCPFEAIGEAIDKTLRDCLRNLREGLQ